MRSTNLALLTYLLGSGISSSSASAKPGAADWRGADSDTGAPTSTSAGSRRTQATAALGSGNVLPNYYYAFAAGSNSVGQCGFDPAAPLPPSFSNTNLGTPADRISPPAAMDFTPSVEDDLVGFIAGVAAGEYHTLLLRCDGSVQSFGRNNFNQLGVPISSQSYEYAPQNVRLPMSVYKVAAGASQSYFLLRNGTLFGSGDRSDGALGLGEDAARDGADQSRPVWIMDGVEDVASSGGKSGTTTTLVKMWDGSVKGFGDNRHSQLGDAYPHVVYSPVEIWHWNASAAVSEADDGDWDEGRTWSNVTEMAVGARHIALLLEDGAILTAGSNSRGQLLRESVPRGAAADPVLREARQLGRNGVRKIECGGEHTLVLFKEGEMLGGGSNAYGQLGSNVVGPDTSEDPTGRYQVATDVREHGLVAGRGTTYYGKGDGSYWGLGMVMDDDGVIGGGGGGSATTIGEPLRVKGMEYVNAAEVGYSHLVFLAGPPEISGIGMWSVAFLSDLSEYSLLRGDSSKPEVILGYIVGRSTDYLTADFFLEDCSTPAPSEVISLSGVENLGDSGDGAHDIYEVGANVNPQAMFESSLWTPEDPSDPRKKGQMKFCARVDGWLQSDSGDEDVAVVFQKQMFDLTFDSTKVSVIFTITDGGRGRRRRRELQGPDAPLKGINGGVLGELCPLKLELVVPPPPPEPEDVASVADVAKSGGAARLVKGWGGRSCCVPWVAAAAASVAVVASFF